MDSEKVLATANIVVTKEDIVKHEVDSFVAGKNIEISKVNKEYAAIYEKFNEAKIPFYASLREFADKCITEDEAIQALVGAYKNLSVDMSVAQYNENYDVVDGKIVVSVQLINNKDKYTVSIFERQYEVTGELLEHSAVVEELSTETNMLQGKVQDLQDSIHPQALEALRVDYMSQIMNAAMNEINGDLKKLLPNNQPTE